MNPFVSDRTLTPEGQVYRGLLLISGLLVALLLYACGAPAYQAGGLLILVVAAAISKWHLPNLVIIPAVPVAVVWLLTAQPDSSPLLLALLNVASLTLLAVTCRFLTTMERAPSPPQQVWRASTSTADETPKQSKALSKNAIDSQEIFSLLSPTIALILASMLMTFLLSDLARSDFRFRLIPQAYFLIKTALLAAIVCLMINTVLGYIRAVTQTRTQAQTYLRTEIWMWNRRELEAIAKELHIRRKAERNAAVAEPMRRQPLSKSTSPKKSAVTKKARKGNHEKE